MTERPLFVRCDDKTVFEINRQTLEAKTCSHYDAYCFSDPRKDVDYMSFSQWVTERNQRNFQ